MAEALKHYFDRRTVCDLGNDLQKAWPDFDRKRYERLAVRDLEGLGLTQRGWAVTEAMQDCLPKKFKEAVPIMTRALGPTLEHSNLEGMAVFRYMPAVFWVAKYGMEHLKEAMEFQYQVTQRFTAEFSLRNYIERYPDKVLPILSRWAKDPSVHVRRLVSEGSRPRLPWAARLKLLQRKPELGLALLELLKDDPELYVRRSVANHLNDISKDHPELAVKTAGAWMKGAGPERHWIVKHALRDLVKKGHPGALAVMGAGQKPGVKVNLLDLHPTKAMIGSEVRFECRIQSSLSRSQDLLVDFAVHFVKANGKTSPKVFKLTRLRLGPGEKSDLSGKVSFRPMTTRKHHPGEHKLELRVNGQTYRLGSFQLRR